MPVPPEGLTVAVPLHTLQGVVVVLVVAVNVVGSLIVTVALALHPLASVTVTSYEPAHKFVILFVVAPVLHAIV